MWNVLSLLANQIPTFSPKNAQMRNGQIRVNTLFLSFYFQSINLTNMIFNLFACGICCTSSVTFSSFETIGFILISVSLASAAFIMSNNFATLNILLLVLFCICISDNILLALYFMSSIITEFLSLDYILSIFSLAMQIYFYECNYYH